MHHAWVEFVKVGAPSPDTWQHFTGSSGMGNVKIYKDHSRSVEVLFLEKNDMDVKLPSITIGFV